MKDERIEGSCGRIFASSRTFVARDNSGDGKVKLPQDLAGRSELLSLSLFSFFVGLFSSLPLLAAYEPVGSA